MASKNQIQNKFSGSPIIVPRELAFHANDDHHHDGLQDPHKLSLLHHPEEAHDGVFIDPHMNIPSSPTDHLQSPCTSRLWGKRLTKRLVKKSVRRFSLSNYLGPRPLPENWWDKIILGSSSVNRKEVLDELGWAYRQISPDIDEKAIRHPDPYKLPLLIAKAKAEAIIKILNQEDFHNDALILTADQIVLYKDIIREKPENREQAIEYLSSYNNDSVSTISAVVVTHYPSGRQESGIDVANVFWKSISIQTIEKVIAKGEIFTSAGGFRIEDDDLNPLIDRIDGTVDSVFGMPVDLTVELVSKIISPLEEKSSPKSYDEVNTNLFESDFKQAKDYELEKSYEKK